MPDREKVIKGLEHCIVGMGCFECPYHVGGSLSSRCVDNIMRDALGIIKKSEPHLIGLSEIKEGETYWFKNSDFVPRPVICVHIENDARKPYITLAWQFGTFSWEAETYGTEWCLWSARPDVA